MSKQKLMQNNAKYFMQTNANELSHFVFREISN